MSEWISIVTTFSPDNPLTRPPSRHIAGPADNHGWGKTLCGREYSPDNGAGGVATLDEMRRYCGSLTCKSCERIYKRREVETNAKGNLMHTLKAKSSTGKEVRVHHNSDWSGDAIVTWTNDAGVLEQREIPCDVLLASSRAASLEMVSAKLVSVLEDLQWCDCGANADRAHTPECAATRPPAP